MTTKWSREFEAPIIVPPRGPRGKSRERYSFGVSKLTAEEARRTATRARKRA